MNRTFKTGRLRSASSTRLRTRSSWRSLPTRSPREARFAFREQSSRSRKLAVLGNRAFKEALDAGKLVIEPRPPDEHIGTSAIDLTLAGEFKRWKQPRAGMEFTIDPAADGFSFQAIASEHHEPFPADEDGSVVLR